MEHMVAFEQPDLLLVPLKVEFQLTVVTAVGLAGNSLREVPVESARLGLHIPGQEFLRSEQDLFCMALLLDFVLERLLELEVLHHMALVFQDLDNLMQVDILTHPSDKVLVTRAQEPSEVLSFLITLIDV